MTEIRLPEGPVPCADLAAYQEDSLVSRTLLKNKGGSLTVFAFSEGQSISRHTAPFHAAVLVLEGRLDIEVGETTHRVEAGSLLHLPADIPHALRAPEDAKMLLVMLKETS